MQTPESAADDLDASTTPHFAPRTLTYDPTLGFHEYRFDYTERGIQFYFDTRWIDEFKFQYKLTMGQMI